jgi:hypothetical protein
MIGYYTKEWEALAPSIVYRSCPSFTGNTGLQLPDISRLAAHSTLSNFANNANDAYITSPDKLALNFDGVNDIAQSSISLPAFSSMSISCWFHPTSWTNTANAVPVICGTAVNFRPFYLVAIPGSSGIRFQLINHSSGGLKAVQIGLPAIGTWTHIIATWDGGNADSSFSMYSNGILRTGTYATTGTVAGTLPGNRVRLGASYDGTGPYSGMLDDVIIFNNVALTAPEARFVFEQGRGGGLLYRPERRKTYFVPPVTGWQSYWFRNQQRMVGGGIR